MPADGETILMGNLTKSLKDDDWNVEYRRGYGFTASNRTTTAPTDAEIAKLYAEETGFHLDDSPAALLDFTRAVLARWGTPQPVAREPLTDAQIAEMMRDTWGCASIAPRHALAFARAVERAHGITQKGGSNGL